MAVKVTAPPTGSKQKHSNVILLNIKHVSDMKVIKEACQRQELPPLNSLDCQKLTKLTRESVQRKVSLVNSIGVGVTPEGQSLFNSIRKTFDDIKWQGKTIVVMNEVYIAEPYRESDITTHGRPQGVQHIQKIVRKFYDDKMNTSTQSIS